MSGPWTRITTVALAVAAALGALIVVLGLVLPVYGSESTMTTVNADGSQTTTTTSGSATMVSVNGWWGLVAVSIPLAVTILVALLLLPGTGRVGPVVAWVLTLAYCGFCVLGAMTIGIAIAPVGLALFIACLAARRTEPAETVQVAPA